MKEPKQRDLSTHSIDEGNIALLALVSIQERIPSDHTSWTVQVTRGGRPAELTCVGAREYGGVPHGLDNDINLALIGLFQAAGAPEDGLLVTRPYQILKLLDLPTTKQYYQALRESLARLLYTTYNIKEGWRDNGRYRSTSFRFIDKLEYTGKDGAVGLDEGSVIRLTLSKDVVESVRSRYIKPLDYELFTSLNRPTTRTLFRYLDARRVHPDSVGAVASFKVGLVEWAEQCKVVDKRPDKIRRTLEPAHQELVARGYLERVEYEGRGPTQTVTYHFGREIAALPDPASVELLTQAGLNLPTAQRYARAYDSGRVRERVERFGAILASGFSPKNRAGLLVDVLKDETGKYADPARFSPPKSPSRKKLPETPTPPEEGEGEGWERLDPEGKLHRLKSLLSLILRRHLNPAEFDELFTRLSQGHFDIDALFRESLEHSSPAKIGHLAERIRSLVS